MFIRVFYRAESRDVQTCQRLSGARHPSDEADGLSSGCLRLLNDVGDSAAGRLKVLRTGIRPGYLQHIVVLVKCLGGFDDRRRWLITARLPRGWIDGGCREAGTAC